MFIENWDRDYLEDQQNVIGRAKVSGAPLTGGAEFTAPDFSATGPGGGYVIPADAHIRSGQLRAQRRHQDPAPRLLVHRRHRPA